MKAVLAKAFGPPEQLVLEELPPRRAGPGEVVIEVKACGVNFFDALIVQGKYQTRPPLPFSPGGEVAGVAGRGTAKSRMQLGGAWRRGPCSWEGGGDGVHATGRGVATWRVRL